MISLFQLLAGLNCAGPFVPPTGFDKDNNVVLFDYEVAVGSEDIPKLIELATEKMISRRCVSGDCTIQSRLWEAKTERDVNCVMIVAEKESVNKAPSAVQINNQKN